MQAAVIGGTRAGDVERGAVVDRRPDDGQPERDVDGLPEGQQLDGISPWS